MAKNIKELLLDATKYPAAIEAKLPAGAPTISATLVDVAGKIPVVPDFPMEIPDLPAVPELPELPEFPGGGLGKKRYVSGVEVRPIDTPAKREPAGRQSWEVTPVEAAGVVGQGHTVRDYA
ncbi:hypothetical protein ES705_37646 [subsurface metagenome]